MNLAPFRWIEKDPVALEHKLIQGVIDHELKKRNPLIKNVPLSETPEGREMKRIDKKGRSRLLLAILQRAAFGQPLVDGWLGSVDQIDSLSAEDFDQLDSLVRENSVVKILLTEFARKKANWDRDHLLVFSRWFNQAKYIHPAFHPVQSLLNALRSIDRIGRDDAELRGQLTALRTIATKNRNSATVKVLKEADRLLAADSQQAERSKADGDTRRFARKKGLKGLAPSPAGNEFVLVDLKQYLGILPTEASQIGRIVIGMDRFSMRHDSPLGLAHEQINMVLTDLTGPNFQWRRGLRESDAAAQLLQQSVEGLCNLVYASLERISNLYLEGKGIGDAHWQALRFLPDLLNHAAGIVGKFERNGAFDVLLFFSAAPRNWHYSEKLPAKLALDIIRKIESAKLTEGEQHVLHRWRCVKTNTALLGRPAFETELLNRVLGDQVCFALAPGEAFSDAVNLSLTKMAQPARTKWLSFFEHMSKATGARPSDKWSSKSQERLKEIGARQVEAALKQWFPLVSQPRTVKMLEGEIAENALIIEDNATVLRGLIWLAPHFVSADMIRTVGALTVSCYRKVAGVGPRCVKVGNAGVYALSQMDDPLAVGQLALLKIKVKFGSARKEIEKAFNQAAERSGLPREELEEMAVPTYGLTEVGASEEEFGDFAARLKITGTDSMEVEWRRKDGKAVKSVPGEVKAKFGKEWKEFQGQAKDIQKMLPAQRERIDGMFLQGRSWPAAVWRERYLDHPLVGTLARRILWEFEGRVECGLRSAELEKTESGRGQGRNAKTVIWFEGKLVDLDLREIVLKEGVTVRLWHPIGKALEEVQAWRSFLEERGISQPFKQAHREIYLLTEAELRTGTYSNRYAAHVLKQHQFNALCAARGWKNQLRLLVDAEYTPPTLHLPQWGLRAEFWVEGIGTDYGSDTTDSGAFLRLSTDQVRFYRIEAQQRAAHAGGGGYRPGYHQTVAEPVPLREIPELVFSEVMRDVDLFVGVSSVGNDPTWADGGPQGRFREYWEGYSFGELSASAKTRREVLQRLVPKLKIAGVCRFEDRYLVVKGSLRSYKIHLGSGNIMMEPNDQYLCIVPKQGQAEESGVMLPFEGDRTLSVILSKAFMLAADAKISDSSIVSQIRGK